MHGLARKHWPLLLGSSLLWSPLGCQSDLTSNAGNQQANSSPVGGESSDTQGSTPAEGGASSDSESSGGAAETGTTGSSKSATGGTGTTSTDKVTQGGTSQTGSRASTLGTSTQQGGTAGRGGSASGGRSSSRTPITSGPTGGKSQGGASSSKTQPGTATGGAGVGGTRTTAATTSTSTGTTTPSTVAQEYVDAHNAVRAAVTAPSNYSGTWVPLPDVTWSEEVAASAQQWANHLRDELNCGLEHEGSGTGYGENLAAGTNLTPAKAVEMWASEKSVFTYTKPFSYAASAGHYTQIVWRTSVEIGCASATCNRSVVISCRYKPPGNMIGGQIY